MAKKISRSREQAKDDICAWANWDVRPVPRWISLAER